MKLLLGRAWKPKITDPISHLRSTLVKYEKKNGNLLRGYPVMVK
jgi:hypothetical protein